MYIVPNVILSFNEYTITLKVNKQVLEDAGQH